MNLAAQQAEIAASLAHDIEQVFARAAFIGGPQVTSFEEEYATFVGTNHCVGVANGTDAVEFSLRALQVGAGDEVIVPANTFVATAEAVVRAGATPVLVDVDDEALLMDPQLVADAVTPHTKAIVPVHLYGQLAPIERIAEAAGGIPLVEDAAQSQGARRHGRVSGSLGAISATSFYPGKNLGAAGDAGAVTTSDGELARLVRLLGNHGSTEKYVHASVGFNSRLDAIQAVVLRHKLRRLDDWNRRRCLAAARYDEMLKEFPEVQRPVILPGNDHVWHLYVIRIPERDRILRELSAQGVSAALHYPVPVHLTPAFQFLGRSNGDFPTAERAAMSLLSLPMFPHITMEQQERTVAVLASSLRG